RACALLVLLTLVGCQPAGKVITEYPPTRSDQKTVVQPNRGIQSPSGLIMLAEAELARGNADAALSLYLRASRQSTNIEVAERAAFLARQVGSDQQIEEALGRWSNVDPESGGALEASLIFAAEKSRLETLESSLTQLLTLEPEYRAHWFASFWAGLPSAQQNDFLNVLTRVASRFNNGSLAMVVTEAKNRMDAPSGTEWLDLWLTTKQPSVDMVLFRARLELPDRRAAIRFVEQFSNISSDLNIRAQLARWYGIEGDSAEALKILRDVIDEDQSRYQDLLTLGLLEMQADNFDAAEARFKALLASEQYRSNAYYHLGEVAVQRQQVDLAIDRFLRVERGELVIEARKQLANLAMNQNNPDQAQRWFSEARLLFPDFRHQLYLAEAQFQTTNNMASSAIPVLTEALSREPESVEILYTRALAFEQLGDIDGAETDLRKILDLKPNDPDAMNALGYTLADRTDRHQEALIFIEKALQQKPESAAILDSMGWVLLKLSRLVEAEPYFVKAWEKSKDHEIAAHYGELLWRLGRQQDAREIWETGYESNPESDKIRATIQRLTDS
ncbi:MAG: tetratricopeptide repeat protein, partial [Gammaproteobacteria bacterium]